jgi:hypothetical protein
MQNGEPINAHRPFNVGDVIADVRGATRTVSSWRPNVSVTVMDTRGRVCNIDWFDALRGWVRARWRAEGRHA